MIKLHSRSQSIPLITTTSDDRVEEKGKKKTKKQITPRPPAHSSQVIAIWITTILPNLSFNFLSHYGHFFISQIFPCDALMHVPPTKSSQE